MSAPAPLEPQQQPPGPDAPLAGQPGVLGVLAGAWGLVGAATLLARAILRLAPVAWEAVTRFQPGVLGWSLAVPWLLFLAYFEGYRGFQRGFAPRVAVRAVHLARRPRPLHVLLAPLFCMGLIHASRRRLVTGWSLVTGVVALVWGVRHLAQPWRGLVDAGVVLGLTWGLVAVLAFGVRALRGHLPRVSADLPTGRASSRLHGRGPLSAASSRCST